MIVSFTPVRVEPETLELHLEGLERQELDVCWFYDDNTDPDSSDLLEAFCKEHHWLVLPKLEDLPTGQYDRAQTTHTWTDGTIRRVAAIKNAAIEKFRLLPGDPNDGLFLIDADLICPPGLVAHLAGADLPIICSVFWTAWTVNGPDRGSKGRGPNVWDLHPIRYADPVERFLEPGHYQVGGLGACTLIRRAVFDAGVDFTSVVGCDFWGEDRHFCIRASARNIPLVACSHIAPYHVYRSSDLIGVEAWMKSSMSPAP